MTKGQSKFQEDGTLSVWDLRETRPDKSYASLKLTPTYITGRFIDPIDWARGHVLVINGF